MNLFSSVILSSMLTPIAITLSNCFPFFFQLLDSELVVYLWKPSEACSKLSSWNRNCPQCFFDFFILLDLEDLVKISAFTEQCVLYRLCALTFATVVSVDAALILEISWMSSAIRRGDAGLQSWFPRLLAFLIQIDNKFSFHFLHYWRWL